MNPVYILDIGRIWTGGFLGAYKNIPITDLAALFLKKFLKKDMPLIEGCYMGIVYTAGVGQHPARQAALKAGLPERVNCGNFNQVCASSLFSAEHGAFKIASGEKNIVVVGGMESMSRTPYYIPRSLYFPLHKNYKDKEKSNFSFTWEEFIAVCKEHDPEFQFGTQLLFDSMNFDGLCDAYSEERPLMGHIAEDYVREAGITREEMDIYAYESFTRAHENKEKTRKYIIDLQDEGFPLEFDEGWRAPNADKMAGLKPVFAENGRITAANSSSLADGVSAAVLISERDKWVLAKFGRHPLARIRAFYTHSHNPNYYLTAPIHATRHVCEKVNVPLSKVDVFFSNEAFAAVPLAMMKQLGISRDCMNPCGGAIGGTGHPLGASGTKVLADAVYFLKEEGLQNAVVSLCNAGGEAVAVFIENMKE
ncbi:MAG: thiolase family protein [Candidatus Niyogibacteria bacterium]|nr:thiolase family protein [Candidatus Niyogibacteria bacterium]